MKKVFKHTKLLALVLLAPVALSACATSSALAILRFENARQYCSPQQFSQMRQTVNRAMSLKPGDSVDTVYAQLGKPEKVSALHNHEDLTILKYRIAQNGCRELLPQEGEFLQVVVDDAHLKGIGQKFVAKQIATRVTYVIE